MVAPDAVNVTLPAPLHNVGEAGAIFGVKVPGPATRLKVSINVIHVPGSVIVTV